MLRRLLVKAVRGVRRVIKLRAGVRVEVSMIRNCVGLTVGHVHQRFQMFERHHRVFQKWPGTEARKAREAPVQLVKVRHREVIAINHLANKTPNRSVPPETETEIVGTQSKGRNRGAPGIEITEIESEVVGIHSRGGNRGVPMIETTEIEPGSPILGPPPDREQAAVMNGQDLLALATDLGLEMAAPGLVPGLVPDLVRWVLCRGLGGLV